MSRKEESRRFLKLSYVLEGTGVRVVRGNVEGVEIRGITQDSRCVERDYCFACLKGGQRDGREFIKEARDRGASVLLVERGTVLEGVLGYVLEGMIILESENVRLSFSRLVGRFYGDHRLCMVAVTGTNGKTSTVHFVRELWSGMRLRAASLGTLGLVISANDVYVCEAEAKKYALTTPDPVLLHKTLQDLYQAGIEYVVLEASSHGLDQHRLGGMEVCASGLTNITRDHLDYHGSFEAYYDAKLRLFREVLQTRGCGVINTDSQQGQRFIETCLGRGCTVLKYGRSKEADLVFYGSEVTSGGQILHVRILQQNIRIKISLLGTFQGFNLLCAVGLILGSGGKLEEVIEVLKDEGDNADTGTFTVCVKFKQWSTDLCRLCAYA